MVTTNGEAWRLPAASGDVDGGFWSPERLGRVADHVARGALGDAAAPSERWGAPVARPGKIVCVGLNYRDHAAETGGHRPRRAP